MLDEKQQKEIISAAFEEIKNNLVADVVENLQWDITDTVSREVSDTVKKWVAEEVAPKLIVDLEKQKSFLVDAAIASAESMAESLASGMTLALAENMKSSYSRKKIIEAMFN